MDGGSAALETGSGGEVAEVTVAAAGEEGVAELPGRPRRQQEEETSAIGQQPSGDKQQRRRNSHQSSGRRLQGDHANYLLKFKYETRGDQVSKPQRKPLPRKAKVIHPFNKEKFLATNFHFVVRWDAGMNQLQSPDAVLDWDTIVLVDYSATDIEPYVCPLCLSPPVAPQVTRCGHIFCWPCALAHLSYAKAGYQRCALCFELLCAADLRSVQLRTVMALAEARTAHFQLLRRARDSLFPEAVGGMVIPETAGGLGSGHQEAESALSGDASSHGGETCAQGSTRGGEGAGGEEGGPAVGRLEPGCQGEDGGADTSGTQPTVYVGASTGNTSHAPLGGAGTANVASGSLAAGSGAGGPTRAGPPVRRRVIGPGGVLICGHHDARFAKFTMLDAQGGYLREVRRGEQQQLEAAVSEAVGASLGGGSEAVVWLEAALTHLSERMEQEAREVVTDGRGHGCDGSMYSEGLAEGAGQSQRADASRDAAPMVGEGASQEGCLADSAASGGSKAGGATAVPSPPQHAKESGVDDDVLGRDVAEEPDNKGGSAVHRDAYRVPGRPGGGSHSAPSPEHFFYQEHVGQLVFVHPLNNRCLLKEYGDVSRLPAHIAGTVLEMESCRVDEDCRKRYHFLHHLPLGSSFWWAELDLKGMLSPATLAAFSDEMRQREARRRRQKAAERKESAEARAAEEARRAGAVLPMHLFPELSPSLPGGGVGEAGPWVDAASAVSADELASEDAFPRMGGEAGAPAGGAAANRDATGHGDSAGEPVPGSMAGSGRASGNGRRQGAGGGGTGDVNQRGLVSSPPVGAHSFSRITRMGYAADSSATGKELASSPGNGHGWAAMASRSPPQAAAKPGVAAGKPVWGTSPPGVSGSRTGLSGSWATGQDKSGVAAVLGGGAAAAAPATTPPQEGAKKKKGRGVILLSLGAVRGHS